MLELRCRMRCDRCERPLMPSPEADERDVIDRTEDTFRTIEEALERAAQEGWYVTDDRPGSDVFCNNCIE